jgi:hypothetical protein
MFSFSFKDHLKKRGTPPSMIKSHSTGSTGGDKYRHLEDDVLTLGQMTDLAKTITVPHQASKNVFSNKYKLIKSIISFSSWMNQ